jgi:hypothetical protein
VFQDFFLDEGQDRFHNESEESKMDLDIQENVIIVDSMR